MKKTTCHECNIPKVFQDNVPGLPSFVFSECCKGERSSDWCQLGTGCCYNYHNMFSWWSVSHVLRSHHEKRKETASGCCWTHSIMKQCQGTPGHPTLFWAGQWYMNTSCNLPFPSMWIGTGQSTVLPCASGLGNYLFLGTKMFSRTVY